MPTLCFGGSFNPIHVGHLRCAEAVGQNAGFERILLIPSAQPPHKPNTADLASSADRLAMCRLAAEGSSLFDVSDIETRRGGPSYTSAYTPSYTIDTARELRQQGWTKINWLIGADMLLYLPRWHRPLELLKEVNFIIMARPGWTINWSALPAEYQHLKANIVDAPLIDVSATEIRRRIRAGESIDGLVPAKVADYIAEHGLYLS